MRNNKPKKYRRSGSVKYRLFWDALEDKYDKLIKAATKYVEADAELEKFCNQFGGNPIDYTMAGMDSIPRDPLEEAYFKRFNPETKPTQANFHGKDYAL